MIRFFLFLQKMSVFQDFKKIIYANLKSRGDEMKTKKNSQVISFKKFKKNSS